MDELDKALSEWFRSEYQWHKERPVLFDESELEKLTGPQIALYYNAFYNRRQLIRLLKGSKELPGD